MAKRETRLDSPNEVLEKPVFDDLVGDEEWEPDADSLSDEDED